MTRIFWRTKSVHPETQRPHFSLHVVQLDPVDMELRSALITKKQLQHKSIAISFVIITTVAFKLLKYDVIKPKMPHILGCDINKKEDTEQKSY